MLLKVFQPYVTHIVHNNENQEDFVKAYISYDGHSYEISTLDFNRITNKVDTDILILNDTFAENYTQLQISEKINYRKAITFFTNGEAYQISYDLKLYLENPKNYIISSWINSDFEATEEDLEVFNKDNFIKSTFASFFTIITRPEHNFLKSLTSYRNKIQKDFDIAFYSRYGYKPWRDEFTDMVRSLDSESNIKIKEINNFKHYPTGKKVQIEDSKLMDNYIGMLIKGNVHLHYDYFSDMFDSKVHIVYETSQEESTVFLTEKTIKELLFGAPCYIVGSNTIRNYLQNLGFFTFDMLDFDEENLFTTTKITGGKKSQILEKIKFKEFMNLIKDSSVDEIIKLYKDKFENNHHRLLELLDTENEHRTNLIKQIL